VFGGAVLLGSAIRSIRLDTRLGTAIANEVIPPPDQAECFRCDLFVKKHGAQWRLRKPHCGGYNCAGHVWASRRTAILDEEAIRLIITEDGYRVLPSPGAAVPGDIVVYWGTTVVGAETWLHVARVCEVKQGPGQLLIPWVVSKWGSTIGEWMHRFDDVPYEDFGYALRIEFLTDRP
jgi:hypothetical protein